MTRIATMRRMAWTGWLLAAGALPGALQAQQAVTQTAADGVRLSADYYPAADSTAPIILLFHQAGSNRGEYAPIAPRLVKLGFGALALDQRSGGEMFGRSNETVARLGRSADYLDALNDLEAALAWARASRPTRPVLVWGSSYSASLVFLLAAGHPGEIAGVLSFSPGEYFGGEHRVHDAAAKVTVPIFVTSAKDAGEIDAARSILAASPAKVKTQFVPRVAGVHGSSTLRADRNTDGMQENWRAVAGFLTRFR